MMGTPRGRKPPLESIITIAILITGFSIYWYLNPHASWPIFPIIFGGILPFSRGIRMMISTRAATPKKKRLGDRELMIEHERSILRKRNPVTTAASTMNSPNSSPIAAPE